MADTRYQILYRYVNPYTNSPLINDMSNTYHESFKFYTDRNKPTDDPELEDLMTDENAATCSKFDMLFVYGGTKKYSASSTYKDGYPYVIKDYYIRVPMSPWCVGDRYPSLEAAIQKCKTLANMLSLENIKLVKIVPFDKKLRIK